jgi:signal transduction histidine kinase
LINFWQNKNWDSEKQIISLNELLDNSVLKVENIAEKSRVDMKNLYSSALTLEFNTDIYTFGDVSRLQYVFINLLRNAIQVLATVSRNPRQIDIEYRSEAEHHVISIIDNGIGIDENILDRIWDLFATFRDEGNGLGLSICKTIIQEARGQISVIPHNRKGGATFVVKLIKSKAP